MKNPAPTSASAARTSTPVSAATTPARPKTSTPAPAAAAGANGTKPQSQTKSQPKNQPQPQTVRSPGSSPLASAAPAPSAPPFAREELPALEFPEPPEPAPWLPAETPESPAGPADSQDDSPYQAAADQIIADNAGMSKRYVAQTAPEVIHWFHHILTRQRGLPSFYYQRTAQRLQIPSRMYNQWKLDRYPLERPASEDSTLKLLAVVSHTFHRAAQHVEPWTFQEATTALQQRVEELKELRLSHNRIAQHLHLSHRGLTDLLNPRQRRPRNCPWTALERLLNAEAEILRPSQKTPEMRNREIVDEFLEAQEEEESLAGLRRNLAAVAYGQPCAKCRASWSNLLPDGDCDWADTPVLKCICCGQAHILDERNPDQPEYDERHYAKPYSDCWNCGAPAHNMRRSETGVPGPDSAEPADRAFVCTLCSALTHIIEDETDDVLTLLE